MVKKNILYAEDYESIRELTSEWFQRYLPETNLEIFKDGISLEKRLQKGPSGIDLVLTDNSMPGPDGSFIIRKYAKLPGFEKVPFILYYGNTPEIGKQAVRDGAFAYLEKSGDYKNLIQLVKSALKIE